MKEQTRNPGVIKTGDVLARPDRQAAIRNFFAELEEIQNRYGLRLSTDSEHAIDIVDECQKLPFGYAFSAVMNISAQGLQLEMAKAIEDEDDELEPQAEPLQVVRPC